MPFPAYSYRYFVGSVQPATELALAPVPAGYRFVINYASFNPNATGSSQLIIYLMPGRTELTRLNATGPGLTVYWDGRLVLHEGEYAQLRAIVGNFTGSIAGWLLSGSGGPAFPATMPA